MIGLSHLQPAVQQMALEWGVLPLLVPSTVDVEDLWVRTIETARAAGLVDHMHIVVVPILLGRGVRLWDGLEGLEKDYQVEAASSPSGVTHVMFTRTAL